MNNPAKNFVKLALRGLSHIEELFLGIGLIIIVFLIFGNVFSRFLLGKPYAWPDETAKFLHVILLYFGVSVASRKNVHLKIDLVPNFLPSLKNLYAVILSVGGIVFGVLINYFAYEFFVFQRMIQDKSYVTAVPMWIIALLILVACFFVLIREVERFFETVRNIRNESRESKNGAS
jgi:TRAP-type C4-dicarboxylate transport system permease small subunit